MLPHPEALTVNGKTMGENCEGKRSWDREVIRTYDKPIVKEAGFLNLKGNLFDSAIMKTSVISEEFRDRYLSNPNDPDAFEGTRRRLRRARGLSRAHQRSRRSASTRTRILVIRGTGPIGYPGGAEVVNMQPPDALLQRGINELPCIGDGRQSGTSGSPSILNASPEAAVGGGLALVKTGDRIRIDLNKRAGEHPHLRRGAAEAPRRREGEARQWRARLCAAQPDAVAGDPARRSSASSTRAWC